MNRTHTKKLSLDKPKHTINIHQTISKPKSIETHTQNMSISQLQKRNNNDNDNDNDEFAMNMYLSSLNGRRFQNITDSDGKEIDMNIVIANMPERERKKILCSSSDDYNHDIRNKSNESNESNKCIVNDFGVFLNGVKITKTYLTKGQPVGYDNPKFKFWKIINKK